MILKFALVIANTEYQDESFSKLTAPGKDAEEFALMLKQPDLAAFDDVQVLLNEGNEKTRRAIARFFKGRKPDDLLLLYFSGHGVRNDQGRLFLATSDTEMSILEATGLPAEFITDSMNDSRSKRQVLILDCCNSGAFDKGTKTAGAMGMGQAFGGGFGRVVLTATDAIQFAWEGNKLIEDVQNSLFTHFLIEGLKGNADIDGDGKISVDELYEYAYDEVLKITPKQTPSKWTYKQQGGIFLRENLVPSTKVRSPEDELLEEGLKNWKTKGVLISEDALRFIEEHFDGLKMNQASLKFLIYSSAQNARIKKLKKRLISKISSTTKDEIITEWLPRLRGKSAAEKKRAEKILAPFWYKLPFFTGQKILLKNMFSENKEKLAALIIFATFLILLVFSTISVEPKHDWVPLLNYEVQCKIKTPEDITLIATDFIGEFKDIVFFDGNEKKFVQAMTMESLGK